MPLSSISRENASLSTRAARTSLSRAWLPAFVAVITILLSDLSFSAEAGGPILGEVIWKANESPYKVTRDVIVTEEAKLVIEPGTKLKISKGVSIKVFGELIARGRPDSPIVFTANSDKPGRGYWGGIIFEKTSKPARFDDSGYLGGSIIEYSVIEYCGAAEFYGVGAMIYARDASPLIMNNVIRHGWCPSEPRDFYCIITKGDVIQNYIEDIHASDWHGTCWVIHASGGVVGNIIKGITTHATKSLIAIEGRGSTIKGNYIDSLCAEDMRGGGNGSGNVYAIYVKAGGGDVAENVIRNVKAHAACNKIEVYGIYAPGGSLIFRNSVSDIKAGGSSCDYTNWKSAGIFSRGQIHQNQVYNIISENGYQKDAIGIEGGRDAHVINNIIRNIDGIGISGARKIMDNSIDKSEIGITPEKGSSITGNKLRNYNKGVVAEENCEISGNIITNGRIGVMLDSGTFVNNAIYNNSEYNFYVLGKNEVDISNNYWNTQSETEIYSKIFDYYSDVTKAKVSFTPIIKDDPFANSPLNDFPSIEERTEPSMGWLTGETAQPEVEPENEEELPKLGEVVSVDDFPEVVYKENPVYPQLAKQAGIEGVAWISVLIDRKGNVRKAQVHKTSGVASLDDAAVEAAYKYKFKAAMKNGQPVATWLAVRVKFELSNK